jgi:hypothetical protein
VRAVADYWAGGETENSERRRLAGYLVDGISGKRSVMYEVRTREIPARSLLCLAGTPPDPTRGPDRDSAVPLPE